MKDSIRAELESFIEKKLENSFRKYSAKGLHDLLFNNNKYLKKTRTVKWLQKHNIDLFEIVKTIGLNSSLCSDNMSLTGTTALINLYIFCISYEIVEKILEEKDLLIINN